MSRDYLNQIGNTPFFITPDEPASPFDCDRWPGSPFCAGAGFSVPNPFKLDVSLSSEIIADECDIGISVTPFLVFEAPLAELVYRKNTPACRQPPPPPTPPPNTFKPIDLSGLSDQIGYYGYWVPQSQEYYENFHTSSGLHVLAEQKIKYTVRDYERILTPSKLEFVLSYQYSGSLKGNEDRYLLYGTPPPPSYVLPISGEGTSTLDREFWFFVIGGLPALLFNCTGRQLKNYQRDHPSGNVLVESRYKIGSSSSSIEKFRFYCVPSPPPPPPPPPPPKRKCKCMGCCPGDSNKNNEKIQDLEWIKRALTALLKVQGYENFPINVPRTLTKDDGNLQLTDHAQFQSYIVKQLDALSGAYPIKIKVKDSDPTVPGDQPVSLSLPNQAETLAEILGLVLSLKAESTAILSASIRALTQAGSVMQQSYLAREYAELIIEYLGFATKQKKEKIGLTFTPGKSKLHEILKESEINIVTEEFNEKEDFQDHLRRLLEAAAISKGQNFRKIDLGSAETIIRTFLNNRKNVADDIRNDGDDKDWDEFLNEFEQGFINVPGIGNQTDPFLDKYENRPRIREIGDQT